MLLPALPSPSLAGYAEDFAAWEKWYRDRGLPVGDQAAAYARAREIRHKWADRNAWAKVTEREPLDEADLYAPPKPIDTAAIEAAEAEKKAQKAAKKAAAAAAAAAAQPTAVPFYQTGTPAAKSGGGAWIAVVLGGAAALALLSFGKAGLR